MTEAKVALVTGANKGLGLEIARQLGKQGITAIIGSRDLARGEAAASMLRGKGIDARALKLDVSNREDILIAVKCIANEFGKLDILVNNAGVNLEGTDFAVSTVTTIGEAKLRETFEANFFGPVALTLALLPLIRKSDAGRIVNQSSILGSVSIQADWQEEKSVTKMFAYNSSKAALNDFTIHLAYELRDTNIKVNSAHPGWVKTDMGSDAAPLEVADGARTAVALATLGADGPTGQFIHDGEKLPW